MREAMQILKDMGIPCSRLSDEQINEHKQAWMQRFIPPDKQQSAIDCWCLPNGDGYGDYLWHAFSYKLLEGLVGEEARSALRRMDTGAAVLLSNWDDAGFYLPDASKLTTEILDEITDMVITDADFKWTYAKTHESELGPYFCSPLSVREIIPADYPLLEDFLYHAIFVPPGTNEPSREVIRLPEIFIYIDGFGDKPDDCGVVAETDGRIIGAAWVRIIAAFGHVDDETPELAISVLPQYRGRSTGTMLMTRLFELLRERGYKKTSLSVQKENAAVRFYQRLGYRIIRENDEDYIMMKELT